MTDRIEAYPSLRIIVTGGAGFIGSHTVDQLLGAGHTVWAVDNFRTGRRENLQSASGNERFKLIELDITRAPAVLDLVGVVKPDIIVHLAALVSVPESITDPALNDLLNFQVTRTIVEAAKVHRVSRVVFASTAAVYGDPATSAQVAEDAPKKPLSPYGNAKLASEDLLLKGAADGGAVVRCQRYFNVYGPRQDPKSPYSGVISVFLDCLHRAVSPQIYGDGEQTRDFISVHDVARANVLAATLPDIPSDVVNICTGRATSINELWRTLANGRFAVPQHVNPRSGEIRHSCGAPGRARLTMGFDAQIELAAGLVALRTR